jgi:hypothetical protein
MERVSVRTLLCILLLVWTANVSTAALRTIEPRRFHLGTPEKPEYDLFTDRPVNGQRLEVKFEGKPNATEATLFLWQDDVKQDWSVELNGRRIGKLFSMEAPLIHSLRVPPGALREGENVLSILPPKEIDNIFVGDIRLDDAPAGQSLSQAHLEVRVTSSELRVGLPCRLTIVDQTGTLVALQTLPSPNIAARPGVVYTGNGRARIGLWPGTYTVHATRGFEYGLASNTVTVGPGETKQMDFQLAREVETAGLVACDTHVHTFTLSHHGDATLQERAVTLAGEGIELPVATDHNVFSDVSSASVEAGVRAWLTPITGDEVTTRTAHFNVFPLRPGSRVPDEKLEPWTALLKAMRATPGVEVIVLNHPLNVHNGFQPFASTNFNRVTGESRQVLDFGVDAIELVNSSALQSDLMEVFRGWFALLNAGHRITGVGSSDGHDVSRYIVGQGRTYIACPDGRPDRINIENACKSLKEGRALISMGLLTEMSINDQFLVGDLATRLGEKMEVTVWVRGPSWIEADKVELFANGEKIREERIAPSSRSQKARVTWQMPRPRHDQHFVAIATGPGVAAPYWATARPYQPASKHWEARVVGATNPIWIDGDGDQKFTAARTYAASMVERNLGNPERLLRDLGGYDQAVCAQAAGLWQKAGRDVRDPHFRSLLESASGQVRAGFKAFAQTLP